MRGKPPCPGALHAGKGLLLGIAQAGAIQLIAPGLRPEMRQPRMLPLPEELASEETPAFYRELISELRALGLSLRERQIQPIVVYPGFSEHYPGARYLILVGQRRWTAASLVGLDVLDAVVVEPPTAVERVRLQYRENEQREDFSDMERAWTIRQLREAMGGDQVPMEEVATQLGVKRARAYQLRRMLALTPEQQRLAALLRLHETQLRTMLDALHRGQLTPEHVDLLLQRLAHITVGCSLNRSPCRQWCGRWSRRWSGQRLDIWLSYSPRWNT